MQTFGFACVIVKCSCDR